MNQKDTDGRTALMWSTKRNKSVSLLLLNAGADKNIQCDEGTNALNWSIMNKKDSITALLLRNKIDVDSQTTPRGFEADGGAYHAEKGSTALHIAAGLKNKLAVKMLLWRKAKTNLKTIYNQLAADLAESKEIKNMINNPRTAQPENRKEIELYNFIVFECTDNQNKLENDPKL